MAQAHRFNRWMAQTIKPFLIKGLSLEIGAGIGNISQHINGPDYPLVLSDKSAAYLPVLKDIQDIYQMDISDERSVNDLCTSYPSFSNVYSLNVLEHIEQDLQALSLCYRLLQPGGRLIKLVPAHPRLFNRFDTHLGHFRRYTPLSIRQKMEKVGFRVIHQQYFNAVGILGWWFSGNMLKKKQIPHHQMQLFERGVNLFKAIDPLFQSWFGLSIISVGEKFTTLLVKN